MGHWFLHQPHTARRGGEVFARGERGGCGSQYSDGSLIGLRGLRRLYPGIAPGWSTSQLSLGSVENFRMPRHLNCFQLGFVRLRGIVLEAGEFDNIFVQVGETNRERVELRMDFRKQNPDVFRIAPGKFFWHEWAPRATFQRFKGSEVSKNLWRIADFAGSLKPCHLETLKPGLNALLKRNSGSTPGFPRLLCPVS